MRSHSLLALLAACGGGTGKSDAGALDAGVDAAPDAADPAALVEVTAYTVRNGEGKRDPDAIAIFVDPAGNFVKHGQVDANGVGSAYLPMGGTVIVLQGESPPGDLFTRYVNISVIRDVTPGDRLVTGDRTRTRVTKSGIQSSMYASYTPIGSNGPWLSMACGTDGLGNPRGITFHQSCNAPMFDLLAIGDDASAVRKFIWLPGVPYAANGMFTIPDTWQVMPTNTTTFLNVPSNLTRVFASTFAAVDGIQFEIDRQGVELPMAGTNATAMKYVPVTQPTLVVANTIQGIKTLERFKVVTAQPEDVTIDWAALPVPRAGSVQATTTGATWTVTGSGSPDARTILWSAEWLDGNNVRRYLRVDILEPVTATNATTLPPLPSAYAADDPTAAAQVTVRGAAVNHFDYDNIADYAGAKPHGPELGKIDFTMPATPHQAKVSFGASSGF